MSLTGPSDSGKSLSSLLIVKGLIEEWKDIVEIESEHSSVDLYFNLGDYNVLTLEKPFSPEGYIEAFDQCISSGKVKTKLLFENTLSSSLEQALSNSPSGNYGGDHLLASFAVHSRSFLPEINFN